MIFSLSTAWTNRHASFEAAAWRDWAERKIGGLSGLVQAKHATLVELGAPDAQTLPSWIQQYAKQHNIAIEGQAIRMLCDYVGVNLRQLENELQSCPLRQRPHCGPRCQAAGQRRQPGMIWNLTDALSQRNGRAAMRSLWCTAAT
ncbi:MAG: hypothetical protein R3A44_12750 [Caldilineaceae bacterium]